MKRKPSVRGQNDEPRKDKRVRRNFVDPSQMKASRLKGLVCLWQHGSPVPMITGHAFCSGVDHPSIQKPEHMVNWKVLHDLFELKLAYLDTDGNVSLTGAGREIGRSLSDKPILGYD